MQQRLDKDEALRILIKLTIKVETIVKSLELALIDLQMLSKILRDRKIRRCNPAKPKKNSTTP